MNLNQIFAVTILISDEFEETYHVHRPDGTVPTYDDLADRVLPSIRSRVHPASDFEIINCIDVQSSLEQFNNM